MAKVPDAVLQKIFLEQKAYLPVAFSKNSPGRSNSPGKQSPVQGTRLEASTHALRNLDHTAKPETEER